MAQPPDDRADDGLTAELRAQLEEAGEEAGRFAAILEHQRVARQLVSAYQAGRATCPEGYAVVAAAVDWAHAGIGRARPHRPISQAALRTLFGRHLEQLRPGQPVTEADWQHGLAWALAERIPREPVFGIDRQLLEPEGPAGLALLTRCRWSGQEGFDPSAALVDHARDTGYKLSSATWRFILEQLRPDEALEVGQAALEQGNLEVARSAWTVAMQSSDAEVHTRRVRLPASSYDQLAEHDPELAQTLRARQASWPLRRLYYPDHRSQAAYNLAVLRAQAGELDAAETLYRWVVDRGHLDLGPVAMIALGRLCAQQGRVQQARAWLGYAVGTQHPEYAPAAAAELASSLGEHGGQPAARAALERLRTASNPRLAARAALLLGTLLSEEWGGDEADARTALEQAAASGVATAAPAAMVNLGVLLARQDDPGQVAWFRRAVDTDDSEIAPLAALYLASWYQEQGDLARTVAAYQQAIAHEHPDASPRAAYLLGRLQHGQGQVEEAWAAWQQAVGARHPRYSLLAAIQLGDLLMRRRNWQHAKAVWEQASQQPTLDPLAAVQLGQVCADWGQPELAEAIYQRVLTTGDTEGGPVAALGLGFLYESRKAKGNVARARGLYQRVIDAQHPTASPIAVRRLASLNRRTGFGQPRGPRSTVSGQGPR
jgi:predicted negative regulator of RcsB-dependent stress response